MVLDGPAVGASCRSALVLRLAFVAGDAECFAVGLVVALSAGCHVVDVVGFDVTPAECALVSAALTLILVAFLDCECPLSVLVVAAGAS